MKQGIHPEYVDTVVTCTCGNSFETRSTITSGEMRVDVCSACHPFYTGKQKILDTGGRVAKFEARYGKRSAPLQVRVSGWLNGGVVGLTADGAAVLSTVWNEGSGESWPRRMNSVPWAPCAGIRAGRGADGGSSDAGGPAADAPSRPTLRRAWPREGRCRSAWLPPRRPRGRPRVGRRRSFLRRRDSRPRGRGSGCPRARSSRSWLPATPRTARDVILEIKAGEGGEESALFASDLARMYARYARRTAGASPR